MKKGIKIDFYLTTLSSTPNILEIKMTINFPIAKISDLGILHTRLIMK